MRGLDSLTLAFATGVIWPNGNMVIKLVSVVFAVLIAYALCGFSKAVDPYDYDFTTILIFIAMATISQSGLWLSSTKVGKRFRWVTATLMIPSAFIFMASSYEVVDRYIQNRPLDQIINGFYALGLLVYFVAYFQLFKGKQNGI